MLIDRHRTAAVIALSRVPEAERDAHQDALETLLVHLYQNATAAARAAFRKRMDPLPASQKPWGALTRPSPAQWIGLGPPVPAVLVLILGGQDDDPDSAEDGNRLPDRDSKEGSAWSPLYAALDRWDTATILRHIGPMGWQLPIVRPMPLDEGLAVEVVPAQVALNPQSPGQSDGPTNGGGGTTPGDGPAPGNGQAAQNQPPALPPVEVPLWRRPAIIAGGVAALAVGGLVVHALGRPRPPQPQPIPEAL